MAAIHADQVYQAREVASPPMQYDLVIVGAGLAGSGLACALATNGWRVLLVERDHFPRHKVCGEFLSPEAQASLRALGMVEDAVALGAISLDRATVTTESGHVLHARLTGGGRRAQAAPPDSTCPEQAWGISRYALDAALAATAAQRGAELWTGTTVTGWEQADGGMVVRLRMRNAERVLEADSKRAEGGTSTVQARGVVMACGRSGVANLPVRYATRRALNVGIKRHYRGVEMPKQVELYLFAGGYVGINPVENGDTNVCALASYRALARAGGHGVRAPGALIEAAARWNPAFGARLHGAEPLHETECAVAPVDTRRRGRPWDELPWLGDAAAMIPPFCGDGMAMALRSAQLIAPLMERYLCSELSWHAAGLRYDRLWHREFDHRLRIGRVLESVLSRPALAEYLIRLGNGLPALVDYIVRGTRGHASPAR